MRCHDAIERFSDYLDGSLGDEERTGLSVHLEGCASCRREWDFFQRAVSLVGSVGEVEAPPGFAAKVLEKAQRRPWRKLLKTLFFPLHVKLPLEAAALLLIAFGAVLLYRGSPVLQKEIQAPGPPQVQAPPEARPQAEPPAPLAKAAPPPGLAAKRALEPSLDAVLVLRVSDIHLAAAGLQERIARFGGRGADEGRKLKEDVREKTSFDLVLPRGAYPAFKASLPELGELSMEKEALEGGPRGTITVRVTILPATR